MFKKFLKKITILFLLSLIPTPNIKVSIEFDVDNDGVMDFGVSWENEDF